MEAQTLLDQLADLWGGVPPTAAEIDLVLSLAGAAAHLSERKAAPIVCWMAGARGVSLADALQAVNRLAGEST